MQIRKCYHANGTEMDKNFKLNPNCKLAKELLQLFSLKSIEDNTTKELEKQKNIA